MGTVKIELDLPNFEREIELKVIINKDGVQSSTPLIDKKIDPQLLGQDSGSVWKQNMGMASQVTASPDPVLCSSPNLGNYVSPSAPVEPTQKMSSIPSSMMGTF